MFVDNTLLELNKELREVFGLSLGDYEEGSTTQLPSTKYSILSFSLKIPFLFSFAILFCQAKYILVSLVKCY